VYDAQYLIFETVVLTFVYYTVLRALFLFVFFLTSFMSNCCMTEFVDLQNMCVFVRIYVCMYEEKHRGLCSSGMSHGTR
jgi:hypothetical protein